MNEKQKIELLVKLAGEGRTNMDMHTFFEMKYSTFLKWKARVKRMGFDVATKGHTRGVPQSDIYFNEFNYEQGSRQSRSKRDRYCRDNFYMELYDVEKIWQKQKGYCYKCNSKDKLYVHYSHEKGDVNGHVLGLICSKCR